MADAVPAKPTQDLVLAVFLHGFKGGADTSVGSMCESQSRETWVGYSHRGARYSFAAFPNRLQNTMMARGIGFEPVVYPPYDTRGELIVAGQSLLSQLPLSPEGMLIPPPPVEHHVTWLTDLVAEKTAEYRQAGGTGPVRVILFGHSYVASSCSVIKGQPA